MHDVSRIFEGPLLNSRVEQLKSLLRHRYKPKGPFTLSESECERDNLMFEFFSLISFDCSLIFSIFTFPFNDHHESYITFIENIFRNGRE